RIRRGSGPGYRISRRGRRGDRCRVRNDQLLAGRQRTWSFVSIGLQDGGRRDLVAARQDFKRVAGADDDRGASPVTGSNRARDAAGGFDRTGRGRVRGNAPPSSGNRGGRV